MALVTLQEAQDHLRLTATDMADPQVAGVVVFYMEAASEIVVDYLKAQADPTWTDATTPFLIKAAILLQIGTMFHDREGEGQGDGGDQFAERDAAYLDNMVRAILHRHRDPALA